MTKVGPDSFLRYIRHLVGSQERSADSDGALLDQFISSGDEAAFAGVMNRHGPLVLGVCQRLLEQPADIEDAFQAVFLVLVRKARSVTKQQSLGSWLYGVAYRTALRARARAARRRQHERPMENVMVPTPRTLSEWGDLQPILDEEIARLPDKYRVPIVLCGLEGKSNEEAARQLAWPVGTVWGRLSRGRELLRARLAKRGVFVAGAALAQMMTEQGASAGVPGTLATATLQGAAAAVAGQTTAGGAADLAAEVSRILVLRKMRTAAALVCLLGMGIVTAAVLAAPKDKPSVPLPETSQVSLSAAKGAAAIPVPAQVIPKFESVMVRHGGSHTRILFSPDGKLLVSAGKEQVVQLWNAATGELKNKLAQDKIFDFKTLSFPTDGKVLALGNSSGQVVVWDVAAAKLKHQIKAHGLGWTTVEMSPDGKMLASAGEDGQVRLWDAATGKPIRNMFQENRKGLPSVRFSPDGKRLATGDWHGAVRVFDVATGKEALALAGHEGAIDSVRFSPDGKLLASAGSEDNTVRLWDLAAGKVQIVLPRQNLPRTVEFSPDGKILATGTLDDAVRLWDVNTGKLMHTLPGHERKMARDWTVRLAFSPDGRLVATATDTPHVHLWEVATGQRVHTFFDGFPRHRDAVLSVAFSPDSKFLASSTIMGTAMTWKLPGNLVASPPTLEAGHLETLWNDLGSDEPAKPVAVASVRGPNGFQMSNGAEPAKGFTAVRTLAAAPQDAVTLLRQRLKPAVGVDPKKLLADLDSKQFGVRQKAERELEELGDKAVPALRYILANGPPLEVRQRIERILAKLEPRRILTAEELRSIRAVWVLEACGTPEALDLLKKLVQGTAGERLTEEAKGALGRMARSP